MQVWRTQAAVIRFLVTLLARSLQVSETRILERAQVERTPPDSPTPSLANWPGRIILPAVPTHSLAKAPEGLARSEATTLLLEISQAEM